MRLAVVAPSGVTCTPYGGCGPRGPGCCAASGPGVSPQARATTASQSSDECMRHRDTVCSEGRVSTDMGAPFTRFAHGYSTEHAAPHAHNRVGFAGLTCRKVGEVSRVFNERSMNTRDTFAGVRFRA